MLHTTLLDVPNKFWDDNIMDLIKGIRGMLDNGTFVGTAKEIAAILSLIYLSVKAYAMILGEGRFEIMPLFRPFVITLIIVNFGLYANIVGGPGSSAQDAMETTFKMNAAKMDGQMLAKQTASDTLFGHIIQHTNEVKQPLIDAADNASGANYGGWNPVKTASAAIQHASNDLAATFTVYEQLLWIKLSMWFQGIITSVILAIFKGAAYCAFFIQLILMHILLILGPLSFAFSIIGVFRDSWITWTARFISVSFYGTIAFIVLNISLAIIDYGLSQEIDRLNQINASSDYAAIFVQAVAHTDNFMGYLMIALFVAIGGLLHIPVVSGWVINNATSGDVMHGSAISAAKTGAKAATSAATGLGSAAAAVI